MSRATRSLRPLPSRSAAALVAAAALAAGLLLPGCDDNISCVFGGGCRDDDEGGVGSSGLPALLPEDGWWIRDTAPALVRTFPTGMEVGPRTPIGLVFDESMNAERLDGFFELVTASPGGSQEVVLPLATQVLVADGRLLLLLPAAPLPDAEIRVRVVEEVEERPTDVTGQALGLAAGAQVASFTVDAMAADEPMVVGTWPADGDTGQSPIGEVVVVLDRAMDATTVTDASFDVLVGGMPPANDPVAAPLQIEVLGSSAPEPRVLVWRSVDPMGAAVPLGVSADVDVTLSPMGAEIEDADGEPLAETSFSFRTGPLALPVDVQILSQPGDAIGLANLMAGGADELMIEVQLEDGRPGDRIDLFLFGTSLDDEDPQLVARLRSLALVDTGTLPITSAVFDLATLNLVRQGTGIEARFDDGALAVAVRHRRGANATPLKVLDVDPDAEGIQDPLLDTQPPVVEDLLDAGGTTASYRSDEREIAFAGHADEALRSVEVVLTLSGGTMLSNGTRPPVVGSGTDGLFVAAPVALDPTDPFGFLDEGATYELVAYDEALNPSAPVTGTFTQLGAVGTTPLAAGGTLEVEVFDAVTLAPLGGARVITHADAGDGTTWPFLGAGTTGTDGIATSLPAHAPGQAGTIVTVDLAGYDLVTFHGVPAARVSLPLRPSALGASATARGRVSTTSTLAALSLGGLQRSVADTRRPADVPALFASGPCGFLPSGSFGCDFGPQAILPGRIGAQTFLAGLFMLSEGNFSAGTLIQAAVLTLPVPPVASGTTDVGASSFERLLTVLDGATVEELPIELPSVLFVADLMNLTGIDTNRPDDDPDTTGIPRCHVEALAPGLPVAPVVGLGLAFEQGLGAWRVRSAVPGAVTPVGAFGAVGAVDPDLFLRLELRDRDGATSVRRRRLSELSALPVVSGLPSLAAQHVPTLLQPAPGGSVVGPSTTLELPDTLPDGETGLYRVELRTSAGGRGWTLWRPDAPGGANVLVRLPDLAPGGGAGLAAGTITAVLTAISVPALDPTAFLWADLEREYDIRAGSVPVTYQQLP